MTASHGTRRVGARSLALAMAGYVMAFVVIYPLSGALVLAFCFIPVSVAAWTYGTRGGLAGAMAALPFNLVLLEIAGEPDPLAVTIGQRGILGQIVLFVAAVVTGHLRARFDIMQQSLAAGAEAQAALQQMIEAKDRFIASISHELRTPLTTVLGFSVILRDQGPDLSRQQVDEFVAVMAEQASEAAHIIEDLLVVARADLGSLRLHQCPFAVFDEVRAAVEGIGDLGGRTVQLVGEGGEVWADPLRVRQIIRNLITNAVRYGGDDVRVETSADGPTLRLSVIDNGTGVPAGEEERIFDPYYSLDDHRSKPGAVGVGLSVARQLARLMGGDLAYLQSDGRTEFVLELPIPQPVALVAS